MLSLSNWLCLAFTLLLSSANAENVDQYIAKQSPISQAGMAANIGPNGAKCSGAHSGVVLASPSSVNPNYVYTWIRDSSLVFKLLIDEYTQGLNPSLQTTINDWIASQKRIQQVTNPSGSVSSGGLGEPKFYVNETAFTDAWGRPQRDGPALRATSMITYANYLLERNQQSDVSRNVWPLVELDLDYVSSNWNQNTFDLWEEVDGNSFFTTAAQHRALREGAVLANTLGDKTRAGRYQTQAGNLLCYLQRYWSSSGYITANMNIQQRRSGLDTNTILASIHSFDPAASCESATFQPCSDKALANHYAVVNSFRALYKLNIGIASNRGVAIGRYQEDIYYDGNPWYLCTYAAAEQLYDALFTWDKTGSIPVTDISLKFFRQFMQSTTPGSYNKGTSEYTTIVKGVRQMADDFLLINEKYTPSNGGLSEQYERLTGKPSSAMDLTWSYASSLTAFARRAGRTPVTWGAVGLALPSEPCGTP